MSTASGTAGERSRHAALAGRARLAKRLATGLAVAGFGGFAGLAAARSRPAASPSRTPGAPAIC